MKLGKKNSVYTEGRVTGDVRHAWLSRYLSFCSFVAPSMRKRETKQSVAQ